MKGDPREGALIEEMTRRAYSGEALPEGFEGGLDRRSSTTRQTSPTPMAPASASWMWTRRPLREGAGASSRSDDCGVRINPMIVDGRYPRRPRRGVGIALIELISFDEEGNCLDGSFMDYLMPTSMECRLRARRDGDAVPHHPLGAKGWASRHRRLGRAAIVNADRRAARDPRRDTTSTCRSRRRAVGRDSGPTGAAAVDPEQLARRGELARQREPFVTATVVRVQHPPASPRSAALVRCDGTIEGFVGRRLRSGTACACARSR